MMKSTIIKLNEHDIVVCDTNFKKPLKSITASFDTETILLFNGKQIKDNQIKSFLYDENNNLKYKLNELRKIIEVKVWAWMCYTKENGFFMTNNFDIFLDYLSRCGIKFIWCYNATFDFAQIDYQVLTNDKWKRHDKNKFSKSQGFTFDSLQNNMGARYNYKLWIEYRNNNRHKYIHSITFYDFMKFIGGGLKKLLKDLNVMDEETGEPIRKLEMQYNNVDIHDLSEDEINYCKNDVKGLYYAIKILDKEIVNTSNNECTIFGKDTNILTCGGLAKRELLRFLYPDKENNFYRIKKFKEDYKLNEKQDNYVRANYLYRGGISFVNEKYRGKLIDKQMYKYDVNSEYPFVMSRFKAFNDRKVISFNDWFKMKNKKDYECVLLIEKIKGKVKNNKVGVWYNPRLKKYVDEIDQDFLMLMFYDEFQEIIKWYNIEICEIEKVVIFKRTKTIFKKFVNEKYKLKEKATSDKNASLRQVSKLVLNSSYGKLSEKIEKQNGIYEINEETGAVHYVSTDVEINDKSSLNVVFGAKITSMARVYLLSKIREICKEDVKNNFIYCDTDSIHCFNKYNKCDDLKLGKLKCEGQPIFAKYLLPKTYIDIYKIRKDKTINIKDIEIHSKGINIASIKNELSKLKKIKLKDIDRIFNYGSKFFVLTSINVKGGKALIPSLKYLAKPNLKPNNEDEELFINNTEFMFLGEK